MATAAANDGDRSVVLSTLERAHVAKAMQAYLKSIERSRSNELPGSDIYRFRTADMAVVESLRGKFTS